MYFSAFGYEISRRSPFELFARPHRKHHEVPIDHLPPKLAVVHGLGAREKRPHAARRPSLRA